MLVLRLLLFFNIMRTLHLMLGATASMNYRQRTIDFFANRLAAGDRIRAELERQGLIRAEE